MAKVKEKQDLVRQNWSSSFTLIGKAKVGDRTFKIDEKSTSSDWIYNALNLGIDCGEKHGTVYCELSGGYGAERNNNVIYVHGKKENGQDDFKNFYTVAWEDRFEESILEDVGDLCFLTVGLEKDANGKTVYEKFISPYDAIDCINKHLEDDMIVNVKGQLKYSVYNGKVQCKKEVNSIVLSSKEPEDFRASFLQTMLLDKDSAGKDTIDKDKGVIDINAYVLEKFKEFNGWDLTQGGKTKGLFVPLAKTFEYPINKDNMELTAKILNNVFKVKKGITQVTFLGEFVESGASVQATEDDLSDEIKLLVDMHMYSMEEALATCSTNGAKDRRMVLTKPYIKMVGDDDKKVPTIQKFEETFNEEDMQLDCLVPKEVESEEDDNVPPFEEEKDETISSTEDDDLAALLASME